MDADGRPFIETVKPLFRQRNIYRCLFWVAAVFVVIGYGGSPALFLISLAIAVPALVKYTKVEGSLSFLVWEHFGQQLTRRSPQPSGAPISGIIGRFGDRQSVESLVEGDYQGYPIRVLQQTAIFNSRAKNDQSTRQYRVLEITTRQRFYHVFVDSRRNHGGVLPTAMWLLSKSLRSNAKLTVEGDVNRYFDIYVPKNAGFESLVTLTPEKLLALREYGTKFDVEFVDNKIYVISSSKLKSPSSILAYQKDAIELLQSIGVNVLRDRDVVNEELVVKVPTFISFN